MPTDLPNLDRVRRLSTQLDKRCARHERLEPYYENQDSLAGIPPVIEEARLTKLYRRLMPVSEAPWGSLIVDSKLDRLEVSGIEDQSKTVADKVWGAWQDNSMDSESKLAHGAALLDGRCFATVWPTDGQPDIALDDMTQMVVEYAEGSRRNRAAALRRWKQDNRIMATLYTPDGVFKYQGPPDSAQSRTTDDWEKRIVQDEAWPLPLPDPLAGTVPVVEIAVNRRLKPGPFPHARGEFEHCVGLIDRINLLTFLGLVVAVWMGFPMRGVIGDKIRREVLKDDEGQPIVDEATGKEKTQAKPPFDSMPDRVFQLENPDAKIVQYDAADRKNLSVFAELDQLAVITKTPRHYFPLEQGMSNLSAEAIMASEGGMHAAVTGHKASLGEGWEDVLRLAGRILGVTLSPRAELKWKDAESRSLAERADAATKLASINLPWQVIAEIALNATKDDVARWEGMETSSALGQLITAVQQPVVPQNGVPQPRPGAPVGVPAR